MHLEQKPQKPVKPRKPRESITKVKQIWASKDGDITLSDVINKIPNNITADKILFNSHDGFMCISYEYEIPNTKYSQQNASYDERMNKYNEALHQYNIECNKWLENKALYDKYLKEMNEFIHAEMEKVVG